MLSFKRPATAALFLAAGLTVGCSKSDDGELAKKSEGLEATAPKSDDAKAFQIDPANSEVGFLMEAPSEKIRGVLPSGATTGTLQIDPADIAKTTGKIEVRLDELVLYQAKSDAGDGKYSEEDKSDLQNEHARAWLEIDAEAPQAERDKNALVAFAIRDVTDVSTSDVASMSGETRKVTFTAVGDFRLHQRTSQQRVKMEAQFQYAGDAVKSVKVRTVSPLEVGLAEHDVRPRTAFGKLAEKTLGALSDKVAQVASVNIELTASAG